MGDSAIGTDQLENDAVTNAKLSQAVCDAIAAGGGGDSEIMNITRTAFEALSQSAKDNGTPLLD